MAADSGEPPLAEVLHRGAPRLLRIAPANCLRQSAARRSPELVLPGRRGGLAQIRHGLGQNSEKIAMSRGDHLAAKGRLCARVRASALHVLSRCGNPVTIVLSGMLRRETGCGDVQGGGYLGDRLTIVLMGANKLHDRVAHRRWVNGGDLNSASDPDLEQSPGIKRPNSLAYHRARNTELLAQLALGRQGIAGSEVSRDDRIEDPLRDRVRKTWLSLKGSQTRHIPDAIRHNAV